MDEDSSPELCVDIERSQSACDALNPDQNQANGVVYFDEEGDGSKESGILWSPVWQDGQRKSAFHPYRPTTVLTNLQRGNTQSQTPVLEPLDLSFHHRAGQGEITALDCQHEQDIDYFDTRGFTPLMWAATYGQVPTVRLLLQCGAMVNQLGPEKESPLLLAAAGGHHDTVRILLSEGAFVNHMDEGGSTALMFAAYGNHPHCVNELLLRGADLTLQNAYGDTAYGISVNRGARLAQAVIENYLLNLLNPN